ncbi:MAG: immunoglobulin domain-containing protein [Verrucomicrobia bacterium]|nr:immunoglobulin domain-containing protein [Verrucomicrobiota bacterium]
MLGLLLGLWMAGTAQAADVSLTASDPAGSDSWDEAGRWSNAAAPSLGNNYFTASFQLRTPNSLAGNTTFAGGSLTLNGGSVLYKGSGSRTITINNLTLDGGSLLNGNASTTFTLSGNGITVNTTGAFDSTTDSANRTIVINPAIAGGGTITCRGNGQIHLLNTASTFSGKWVLGGNQTRLVADAVLGAVPAAFVADAVTIDGGLVLNRDTEVAIAANRGITLTANGARLEAGWSKTFTIHSPITGAGGVTAITDSTPGMISLNGINTYTGPTVVQNNSRLQINGSLAADSTVTVQSGGLLVGNGTIHGTLTADANGNVGAGGLFAPGTLTVNNAVTLNGAVLYADLANNTTVGGNVNDLLVVNGDLNLQGTVTVSVTALENTLAAGPYTLITYTGNLTGSADNLVAAPSRYTITFDTSTPGQIKMTVQDGPPANLVWQGDNALNLWDCATPNWLNGGSADTFRNGDNVLLDDTGANGVPLLISSPTLLNTLIPGSVTVNASIDYTIGGGRLAGPMTLTKQGSGILTLAAANGNLPNYFTGPVVIEGGRVRAGYVRALGDVAGATLVKAGGALDVNGQNLGYEPVFMVGDGPDGNGAVVNYGGNQNNALRVVTMTGDATVGGSGRFDIRGVPGDTFLNTGGNAYNLTKKGPAQFSLVGVTVDAALGDIDVQSGVFSYESTTTSLGDPAKSLTLGQNAQLILWATANPLDKVIILNGGTTANLNNGSGTNTIVGPVTLNADSLWSVAGTSLAVYGAIGGNGGLTKSGSSPLFLYADNTYSGQTVVAGGSVILDAEASIPNSVAIAVGSGTTLDVSKVSTAHGAFVLNGAVNQTLLGSGSVAGNVTAGSGAAIFPGTSAGTLTINGNLAMTDGSSATIELGAATTVGGGVNDLLAVNGNLTLSGTVTLRFNAMAPLDTANPYTIATYTGTLDIATVIPIVVSDSRYTFTLDPTTSPGSILVWAAALGAGPEDLTWQGNVPGSETVWDVKTTANWLNSLAAADAFFQGDDVRFDDTASGTTATLAGTVTPASLVVSNETKNFTWTGSGKLSGPSAILKQGAGKLTIANAGVNDNSGTTTIEAGTLEVGNGGTGGNLNTAAIANSGTLVFNRSDAVTVPNAISGAGSVEKQGAGLMILSAANSAMDGPVTVAAGTLRTGNAAALGTVAAGTVVADGATLDVNGQSLGNEPITVSGAGVGGAGAIYNSGGGQNNATRFVTLLGDTTFGGVGRWDIRTDNPSTTPAALTGNSFNLTKVGPNETWLVNLGDIGVRNISINQGILGIQGTTTMGDPLDSLTVNPGASLAFYANNNAATPIDKMMVMNNGTWINNNGDNFFTGPITLNGANTLTMSATLRLLNVIDGPGSLIKANSGTLVLGADNTYSGNTVVQGGYLRIGNGGPSGSILGTVYTTSGRVDIERSDTYTQPFSVLGAAGMGIRTPAGVVWDGTATIDITGNVEVGRDVPGKLIVQGTASARMGHLMLGNPASMPGDVVQTGGDVTVNYSMRVGHWPTETSTYTMEGGQLTLVGTPGGAAFGTSEQNGVLYIGVDGTGIFTQKGGTVRAHGLGLDNRGNSAGDDTFNLEGGTFIVGPSGIGTANAANTYVVNLKGGTLGASANWASALNMNLVGTETMPIVNPDAYTVTLSGILSGVGGLTKDGAGILLLNGGNTYEGLTLVNAGVLGGIGSLAGPMTVAVGGTFAPGTSLGTFTVNNAVTLSGTTVMELDRDASPNSDLLAGVTVLTCGGTLQVVNTGAALQPGDTFNLFDAAEFAGSFDTVILPDLAPELAWKVGSLMTDGTLMVVEKPAITVQPASQTVAVCDPATFTVTATGTPPLTYQWFFGANPIPDATAATFTLAKVAVADAGDYSVLVSNGEQSVTSASASLTVGPDVTDPVIVTCTPDRTLACGQLGEVNTCVFSTLAYDNSVKDLTNRFNPGLAEVGDEIILDGTARQAQQFVFEYWGANSGQPAFVGTVQARVRFYANDGAPYNGYPTPGTVLYDSGDFPVDATERATLIIDDFTSDAAVPLAGPLPDQFTWSVQFSGLDATDSAGLDLFSPPVIGSTFPDYWERAGTDWTLKTNATIAVDFAAQITAIDPSRTCVALPDLTGDLVATDNCEIVSVSQSPAAGTLLALGDTSVAFTVQDAAGNSAGCVMTVTVAPLPGVSVDDHVICSGESVTLVLETEMTDASYLWSPGGETTRDITVSPMETTVYEVVVTDNLSGLHNSASATVTVNPSPVVTVNSEYGCPDLPVTLTATHNVANPRFLWAPGGETTPSITFVPTETATYTVTVTDQDTGCATTASGTVTFKGWNLFANTNPIVINDALAASPYPSTITVSGLDATLCRLTVTISNLSHRFPDDIDIILVTPSGEKSYVLSDAGFYQGIDDVTLVFDDLAPAMLAEDDLILSGTYKPTNYGAKRDGTPDTMPAPAPVGPYPTNFTHFNGINPNGVWSLYVFDDALEDAGLIADGWSLAMSTATPFTDVQLTVDDVPDPVAVGSTLTYTLTAANPGPSPASGLVVVDTLPAGVTFVSATASQGACTEAAGVVTCDLGDLAIGASATITLEVIPTAVAELVTSASLTCETLEFDTANNTATATTTALEAPAITGAPVDAFACVGGDASFNVVASGSAPLTYQWYLGADPIPDATNSVLTFSGVQAENLGAYTVAVINPVGSANATATLAFYPAPTITAQPASTGSPMGNSATFSVTVSSDAPPTYQWSFNGTPIEGATGATLELSNLTFADAGAYQVVVGNCGGQSVTSDPAILTVTPIAGISFDFNTPGQYASTPYWWEGADWINNVLPNPAIESLTGGIGGSGGVDFNGTVTSDNTSMCVPVGYDFSLNGKTLVASVMVKVKDATGNGRNTQLGFVTATNAWNAGRSARGINDDNPQGFMTVILQCTANATETYQLRLQTRRTDGGIAEVTPSPTPQAALAIGTWYKLVATFANITGTAADTLTVSGMLQEMGPDGTTPGAVVMSYPPVSVLNPSLVQQKSMFLAVRTANQNTLGPDFWDNLYAYANPGPVYFVAQPASQTVVQGSTVTFRALVDGEAPYTYQWQKSDGLGGFADIPGAGNWKYTTPQAVLSDDNTQYRVVVTGPANSVTSEPATLTVQPLELAVVSAGSADGLTVGVRFNQPVDKTSAENPAHYTINGAPVLRALLRPDERAVSLTPSAILTGVFTVEVQNVVDLSGGALGAQNSASGTVAGLTSVDVNAPLTPGETFSDADGAFELIGGGADIWGTADQFHYVYGQHTGDFDVRMQVPRMDIVRTPSKAAFVMRESLDPPSRMLFVEVNPMWPARQYYSAGKRDAYGASANGWQSSRPTASYPNAWMRFRRVGDTFTVFAGTDGLNWAQFGQTTAVYPETVYLGIGACAVVNASGTPFRTTIQAYSDVPGYPGSSIVLLSDPADVTVNAGATATLSAAAVAVGAPNNEIGFVWQRSDGAGGWVNVPGANSAPNLGVGESGATNSFTTGPLYPADNGAQFRVIAKIPGDGSVTSAVATVTVGDTTPPTLVSAAVPALDIYQVVLVFSEPLSDTATVTANYAVKNAGGADMGVVSAVFFGTDPRTVILTTTAQLVQGSYTVTVNNVQDLNGNTIAPDATLGFDSSGVPTQPVVIEAYQDVGTGDGVSVLLNHALYTAGNPTFITYDTIFAFNPNINNFQDGYGVKAYTYYVPPTTGTYKFWVRNDDDIELWMNTSGTDPAGATRRVNQTSASGYNARLQNVNLTGGQPYYMEVRLKENSGNDGFSIVPRYQSDGSTPAAGSGAYTGIGTFLYPAAVAPRAPTIVEIYTGQGGSDLANLAAATNLANFVSHTPTRSGYSKYLAFQPGLQNTRYDNYVGRLCSYFVAPSNGLYRFWIRSDDASQLFMNTNAVNSTDPAGAKLLASQNGYNANYTTSAQNVPLVGGQKYYIEGRWKEGTGGDGMTVAVRAQSDGATPPNTEWIRENLLEFPAELDASLGAIAAMSLTPVNPSVGDGQTVTFTVSGITGSRKGFGYLWLKNGQPISAPNAATFTTPALSADDDGAVFSVLLTNQFSSATLASTVTVTTDTTPPQVIIAAGSQGYDQVTVLFDEPLDLATATYVPNYQISGTPSGVDILYASLDATRTSVTLWTTLQTPGQVYTLDIAGVRDVSTAQNTLNTSTNFTAWNAGGTGVYVELFTNISGTAVANLMADAKYQKNLPDLTGYVPTFGFATYTPGFNNFTPFSGNPALDNYGVRMSALFVPPSNGVYRFYIKSDDASQLFINPNGPSRTADLVIPTSGNHPGGEHAGYAIDNNAATKYLNFDKLNAGFTLVPRAGATVVAGLRLTTANDWPERDPMTFILEGTTGSPTAGPWIPIASGSTELAGVTARLTPGPTVSFANADAYTAYRIVFPTIRSPFVANCMQVAEVEFLDASGADIADPGRMLVAREDDCCDAYGDASGGPSTADLPMLGGQAYYIELLGKEGGGGDYFHVAVRGLDDTGAPVGGDPVGAAGSVTADVIPGEFLSPFGNPDINRLDVTQTPPSDVYATENDIVTLSAQAAAFPPQLGPMTLWQWSRYDAASGTFIPFPGATSSNFTFFAALADDGVQYRLRVSLPGTLPYDFLITMHVAPDVTPPYMVSANSIDGNVIDVQFNERLDPQTAFDFFNYRVFVGINEVFIGELIPRPDGTALTLKLTEGSYVPMTQPFTVEAIGICDVASMPNCGDSSTNGAVEFLTPLDINTVLPGSDWNPIKGSIDMTADGADIWGTADGMRFAYREVTGNFDIKVRVEDLVRADNWTKAGLMARASTNATAPNVTMLVTPTTGQNTHTFQWRYTEGASSASIHRTSTPPGPADPPAYPNAWVRLQRLGSIFAGYFSTDGVNWTLQAARDVATNVTAPFPATMLVGLAVTSHTTSSNTVATFRDLYFPQPATIDVQPEPAYLVKALHESASYSVVASVPPDSGTISYQWWKDGAPIPGATDATLNLADLQVANSGTYFVTVSGDGGGEASNPVTLVVSNTLPVTVADTFNTTQNAALTFPVADLLANDTDPEGDPLSVLYVSGLPPTTFTADFNDGLVPAGASIYGTGGGGVMDVVGGAGDSGCAKLTLNAASQAGSLILNELTPGKRVSGFTATFKLRIGDASTEPADGISFNFASDLPIGATTPAAAENGGGSGISFCIDSYRFATYPTGGTANTSGMKVRYGNVDIAGVQTLTWNGPGYATVNITLAPDGAFTVMIDGTNVFGTLMLPYVPTTGRFGIYARTGGQYQTHWLDDLSITVLTVDTARGYALGGSLYGNAYVKTTTGVGDSGALHLTDNVNSQSGAFVINELTPGVGIDSFTASFKLRIGDGTSDAADGFSFNLASDLPDGTAPDVEEGVGTGLSLCVDNYPAAGPDAPAFKLKWGGALLGQVIIPKWNDPNYLPITINLDADGTLDVLVAGTNFVADVPTPYLPVIGRFGLFARTGGQNQTHWVDDLSITAVAGGTTVAYVQDFDSGGPGQVTMTGGVVTYTPPGDGCGTDQFYYVASDGQLGGLAVEQVTVNIAEGTPEPPVITSCPVDFTLALDAATCVASMPDLTGSVMTTDNCCCVTVSQMPAAGVTLNAGVYPVVLTATDSAGLTDTCTVLVTVTDQSAPLFSLCPEPQFLKADAACQASLPDYTLLVVATDCSSFVLTQNPAPGAALLVNSTTLVDVVATDLTGLTATCTVTVVVQDITPPEMTCPSSQVVTVDPATCTVAVPDFVALAVATDNCGVPIVTQTPPAGTLVGVGITNVVVTATDVGGNIAVCNVSFEVTDPVSARLSIALNGANVVIAWPKTCTAYQLMQASNLNAPIAWSQVAEPPALVGDHYEVAIPATSAAIFYRLQRQ